MIAVMLIDWFADTVDPRQPDLLTQAAMRDAIQWAVHSPICSVWNPEVELCDR